MRVDVAAKNFSALRVPSPSGARLVTDLELNRRLATIQAQLVKVQKIEMALRDRPPSRPTPWSTTFCRRFPWC
jgi:hypothetical protein